MESLKGFCKMIWDMALILFFFLASLAVSVIGFEIIVVAVFLIFNLEGGSLPVFITLVLFLGTIASAVFLTYQMVSRIYKRRKRKEAIKLHDKVEKSRLASLTAQRSPSCKIEPVIQTNLTPVDSVPHPQLRSVEAELLSIDLMDGHDFEYWCASLLRKLGFQKVEVTQASGDDGVDIIAEKDGIRYAVQCKRYSSDLGNTPIQEVHTGKSVYHCHVGAVMTNQHFTVGGKRAAEATGTLLWDRDWIAAKLRETQSPPFVHVTPNLTSRSDNHPNNNRHTQRNQSVPSMNLNQLEEHEGISETTTLEEMENFTAAHPVITSFITKVVGVSFENEDGTSRQDILSHCLTGEPVGFYVHTFNGLPAYAVISDHGQIGYLSQELACQLEDEYSDTYISAWIGDITGGDHGLNYGCTILVELRKM